MITKKKKPFSNKEVFSIGLILLLAFSRIIPHLPNFTPIIAMGIMSGYLFRNLNLSFIILLLSMLLADLFIGFYPNMFFVYLPLFLITFFSHNLNMKINSKNLFLFGFLGSFLFFLLSNFGVWIFGTLYTKNISGLIECYFMALPFFKNTLVSTIIYLYVAFFIADLKKLFFEHNYIKK